MAADKQSKTEKPTPRRLREARREGQIPKSQELGAWGSMLAMVVLGQWTLRLAGDRFGVLFRRTGDVAAQAEMGPALGLFGDWLRDGLLVIAPMAVGSMLIGVLANLAQVGFSPSTKLLKPKLQRVNPWKGLKRLLGPQTAWESGKVVFKVAVLTAVVARSLLLVAPALVDAGRISVIAMVGIVGEATLRMVRDVAIAGLVLAGADYAFQRRRVGREISMTKDEVKREYKDTEGDPQLKGAIRSKQLAMSRNRMMADVVKADVIVVNPTHFSVALVYDALAGPPKVVAKGAGVIALRIREVAAEHEVPIVEDVPLARTLFRACEIGDTIPQELFDAVAKVLAFIFALKRRGTSLTVVQRMPQPTLAPAGAPA
jgi:flagellar biosynthetic protein FlhB